MKKISYILFLIPVFLYSQGDDMPIIDMHLHDYTEQTYFTAPAPDGVMSPKDYPTYRRLVLEALKKNNVKKSRGQHCGWP